MDPCIIGCFSWMPILFVWSIFCSLPLNSNCIPNNIAQVAFIKHSKALDCYLFLC